MSKATVVYQGGQSTYNFPFDYLAKVFVKVDYIKLDGTIQTLNYSTDYAVVDKSIVCTTISAATDRVKIYRQTTTDRLVTFVDSSILRAKDLNALDVQLLHINEESMDRVEDAGLVKDIADGKWNAKQAVIKNVADGTSQYDAVNRGQLDAIAGSASASATSAANAKVSENNAWASAIAAGNSANASATSAANAKVSENNAWASAIAANNSASASATSASAADTSKNQAASLKADTQVLRDDTKVMHDEVMTATPSRCLPLVGGIMGVGQQDTDIINGGSGSLFILGSQPSNKPATLFANEHTCGIYDLTVGDVALWYGNLPDQKRLFLGKASAGINVEIDGYVNSNLKFNYGDHSVGTPNNIMLFGDGTLSAYDALLQRQWLSYTSATNIVRLGHGAGSVVIPSVLTAEKDFYVNGGIVMSASDSVIKKGDTPAELLFKTNHISLWDPAVGRDAWRYNAIERQLHLGEAGIQAVTPAINVGDGATNTDAIVNLNSLRAQTRPVLLWSGNTTIGTSAVAIPVAWSLYNIIHITWWDSYEQRLRVCTLVKGLLDGTVNASNTQVELGVGSGNNSYGFYLLPAPSDTSHLTCFAGSGSVTIRAIHGLVY